MIIYVGNLSHQATENELSELFVKFGEVKSARIIKDHFTGKSRGFAFVEMEDAPGNEAIESLNETDFMERTLTVNKARPKTSSDRPKGNFYNKNKKYNKSY